MTRKDMLITLRNFSTPSMEDKEAIAAQLQADGETIARLEARVADRCEYIESYVEASAEWAAAQEVEIVQLKGARDAAISALAEEGRKRGEAEAIIAEMLRLDHDGSEEEWRAVCDRARAALRPADKGDAT